MEMVSLGVDVSQLQDGSFPTDQKADAAKINPERRKTSEASVTEREKSRCEVSGSDSMALHTDGRKESMRRVNVTIHASSGNSCHADEIQSDPQGDEVRSCGNMRARTSE